MKSRSNKRLELKFDNRPSKLFWYFKKAWLGNRYSESHYLRNFNWCIYMWFNFKYENASVNWVYPDHLVVSNIINFILETIKNFETIESIFPMKRNSKILICCKWNARKSNGTSRKFQLITKWYCKQIGRLTLSCITPSMAICSTYSTETYIVKHPVHVSFS